MSDEKQRLSAQIIAVARKNPTGPVKAADLTHLASSTTVHQALSRLARSGYLTRAGRGSYVLNAQQLNLTAKIEKTSRYRHILSVAAPLFGRQGYYGVSLRDIAQASGLRIATLYNYFPDKDGLYEAVLKEAWADGARRTLEILPSSGSPHDRLRLWIEYVLAFYFEDGPAAMLRDRELLFAHNGNGPRSDLLAATADSNKAIQDLIRQINPPIAATISPPRISELIYSMCYGIIKFRPAMALIEPDRYDLTLRAITDDVLSFVTAALGWRDASTKKGRPSPSRAVRT